MSGILDELRAELERSEESRYRISKTLGISEAQLSRFALGRCGLSVTSLERVADHLGFEVVLRSKRQQERSK